MLPSGTGILLNTVDQQLKTSANSIANTCYNIFGFLPAPLIFGYISDIGGIGHGKRAAMGFLMTMPAVAVAFFFIAAYNMRKKGFGNLNQTE